MVEQSDAARRLGATDHARPDALAYWYLQEITPLDEGDARRASPEPADEAPRLASGWWLLPVLLLSVPAWIAIVLAVG